MLQMAAEAAAPAARPSRTAETSTSTLWAPDAPLLRGLNATPTVPPVAGMHDQLHLQQHEPAVQPQHAQQKPQQAGEMATQAAQPTAGSAQSAAASGGASTSSNTEVSQPTQTPSAAQQQAQQMQHHDANQPWARAWSQPALPAVTVAAGRPRLGQADHAQQQRRRETVAEVAVSASLQQHRHSHGLHAVRSLSWSQSAEEQPVGSLHSSGKSLIGAC